MDGVFAPNDAAGWADRRRCRGTLRHARGLARKSCGKSRISGSVFARCFPFPVLSWCSLRDEATMGCRARLLRVRSEGEGRGFCRMSSWVVPAAHGGGGADGNCRAAITKKRRDGWLGRGVQKMARTVTRLSEPLKESGDRDEAELSGSSVRCRMVAKFTRRPSAECCMRRRGGRALEA